MKAKQSGEGMRGVTTRFEGGAREGRKQERLCWLWPLSNLAGLSTLLVSLGFRGRPVVVGLLASSFAQAHMKTPVCRCPACQLTAPGKNTRAVCPTRSLIRSMIPVLAPLLTCLVLTILNAPPPAPPVQARAAKERERAEREREAERARAQREKEAEARARAQQEAR